MSEFVSREVRQILEGLEWKRDFCSVMYNLGICMPDRNMESFADQMLHLNKDEGGELMEEDAKKFLLDYMIEVLSD